MSYKAADAGKTMAIWEVGSWLLENFASVEEVKANIGKIVVPTVVFAGWGFAPEAHLVVHDASGKSIVIEYVGGKLNVYDNPLGVITNSPAFDWQMTNLRNYVNFSMTNVPPVKLGSVTLEPFGQGLGMLRPLILCPNGQVCSCFGEMTLHIDGEGFSAPARAGTPMIPFRRWPFRAQPRGQA
jgi:choloylglycine hydrolase